MVLKEVNIEMVNQRVIIVIDEAKLLKFGWGESVPCKSSMEFTVMAYTAHSNNEMMVSDLLLSMGSCLCALPLITSLACQYFR